jgi:pimeloyl-ACP methyl ester carboxylesterase
MSLRRFLRLAPKVLLGLLLVAGIGIAMLLGPYAWRVQHVDAAPANGFHSGYYLYVPASLQRDADGVATLLVQPNNSGRISDDLASHRRDAWMTGFERKQVAEDLGVALLVPAFPRPARDWRVYTHALDRDVLTTRDPALARLDLQLIAMIDDARTRMHAEGTQVDARVLLQGYSASAMFANRFTALHPQRVRAATIGSPGGWPIAPVAKVGVAALPYPAGIADLQALTGKSFDAAAFARVPQFLYMGDADDNDSLDFGDGWDKPMASEVDRLFGTTPLARWKHAEALYAQASANARFELVPGVGHDRKALQARSTAFFKQVLATPR